MAGTKTDKTWADEVHAFWFEEVGPKGWFAPSDATDRAIIDRFQSLHQTLAGRPSASFLSDARVALSAVIVLDQFPRNMFRGTADAFATDGYARDIADAAISAGLDSELTVDERVFLYLPFEHSEDLDDQERAVALISALGDDVYTDFAERHRDVIARFGRFPHRNEMLARTSTADERAFLEEKPNGF
ncbi:MAG: DUF924 family protein [Pseudomonadota bacterium]